MTNFHKPWVMPSINMTGRPVTVMLGSKGNERFVQAAGQYGSALRTAGRGSRFNLDFNLGSLRASWADARAFVEGATAWFEDRVRYNWTHGLSAGGRALKARSEDARFYNAIPGKRMTPRRVSGYENQVLDGTFVTIRERVENAKDKSGPYARGAGGMKLHAAMHKQEQWVKGTKKRYTNHGKRFHPNPDSPAGMWSGLLVDSWHATPTVIRSKKMKFPTKVTVRFGIANKRRKVVFRRRMNDLRPGDPTWIDFQNYCRGVMTHTTSFDTYKRKQTAQKLEAASGGVWRAFMTGFKRGRALTRSQLLGRIR
jgi:hypothetical protein